MLKNSSFESRNWEDVSQIAQEPEFWNLDCLDPGETLYGSDDEVITNPECVHKLAEQLPEEERPGGSRPLIRSGSIVYKLFAFNGAWGATLTQTVENLEPGSQYEITVPFQFHDHSGDDPWAAEFKVELNSNGDWINIGECGDSLEDHHWNEYTNSIIVPENGSVEVKVYTKAKYGGVDCFIDAINDSATEEPTPEPEPEPEPSEWDYRVIEEGSKLSVHSIFSNSVVDFSQTLVEAGTKFPVVKAVDDLGWLVSVKEVSPNTITIARLTDARYEECPGVEEPGTDLEALARKQLDRYQDKIDELGNTVDYWEIWNEPDPPGAQGYERLAELMIKTMQIAEERNIKCALFSLCAGTPEWNEMQAMVETGVFARMKEGGHILALHEGTFGDQEYDTWWGDRIPGSPEVEGAGALNFRYRYLYYLLEQRDEIVPLVVTEWYSSKDGRDGEAAVEAIQWYDQEASKDYYHWGFCPFTLGASGQWQDADYEGAYQNGGITHMIDTRDRNNAQPEEVTEERGKPRVQYKRTYVLLPPDADAEWANAVVDATWDSKRYTVGASADDAGIGDLDARKVIAVNPSAWDDDLESFYAEYYPEINYNEMTAETPEELKTNFNPPKASLLVCQGDEPWGDQKYASGNCYTFGAKGCWISDCASAQRYYGIDENATPLTVDATIGEAGYLNCAMRWSAMPKLGLKVTAFTRDEEKVKAHLDNGDVAFAEVSPTDLQHFVFVAKYAGDKFWMHDPYKCLTGWITNYYEGIDSWRLIEEVDREFKVGVHAAPVTFPPADKSYWLNELKSMDIEAFKILTGGGKESADWAYLLSENSIMPIVRLYEGAHLPDRLSSRLIEHTKEYKDGTAFEIYNEPNLAVEHKGDCSWQDTELVNTVAENWWLDALEVISRGGRVAFPAMAPTDSYGEQHPKYSATMWFRRMLQYLKTKHLGKMQALTRAGDIWLAVHSARFSRAMSFDPFKFAGAPDNMCLRSFEVFKQIYIDEINEVPLVISTEGGVYSPEHMWDIGWEPDYDTEKWGDLIMEMFDYLDGRIYAMCSWNLTDQGVPDDRWTDNGWYSGKEARPPAERMKNAS